MSHKIRNLIGSISPEILHGFVDLDETYVGGKLSNKSKSKREELYARSEGKNTIKGRNTDGKTPVFAMVQRNGSVIAYVMPKIRKDAIYSLIKAHIHPTAKVSTDESVLYTNLEKQLGLEHGTVVHSKDEYRKGWFCTNSVEGYFSQLKRAIKGTHLHVSEDYLQNYVNECSFRFNHRKNPTGMFNTIINQIEPVVK
jgi:transposase